MIIDIHTHLWPPEQTPEYLQTYFKGRKRDGALDVLTAAGLIDSMNRTGINKSIVSALCFEPDTPAEVIGKMNDYVRRQCQEYTPQLIPFCTINPLAQDAVTTLRRLLEEDNFKGLKLHGNMQRFYPDDTRLYPIYEMMQAYGLPILFHSGGIGLPPVRDEYGYPLRFDAVACDFPALPIILGHAGRIWYNETAMMLRKHKNIYADISTNIGRMAEFAARPMADLLRTVKVWAGTTATLLFGSDYPFYDQKKTIDVVKNAPRHCAEKIVSDEDITAIMETNAQRFCEKTKIILN